MKNSANYIFYCFLNLILIGWFIGFLIITTDLFYLIVYICAIILQMKFLYTNYKKYKLLQKLEKKKFEENINDLHNFINDWFNRIKDDKYKNVNNKSYYISTEVNNAYQLLGLKFSDNIDTIKKTYRKLAMKWHPDKYVNDINENQKISKRNFQKINNAYSVIKKYKKFS